MTCDVGRGYGGSRRGPRCLEPREPGSDLCTEHRREAFARVALVPPRRFKLHLATSWTARKVGSPGPC